MGFPRGKMIDYKIFDTLGDKKSRNKIIAELVKEAKDIDELEKLVQLDRTSIFYHLKEMQKEKIVLKRFVGKKAYFGLIQKKRKEVK